MTSDREVVAKAQATRLLLVELQRQVRDKIAPTVEAQIQGALTQAQGQELAALRNVLAKVDSSVQVLAQIGLQLLDQPNEAQNLNQVLQASAISIRDASRQVQKVSSLSASIEHAIRALDDTSDSLQSCIVVHPGWTPPKGTGGGKAGTK